MLDVHAPDQKIHGTRDFFIHLLTITAGLLIALGLEASVEAMHHRHQRREAEQLIREEIRKNAESLQKAAPGVLAERTAMRDFIHTMRIVQHGDTPDLRNVTLAFHEEEIPDAAWRTASSTGVLEYMPYEEVERFADAYREQALLQGLAQQTLEDYLQITAVMDSEPYTPGHKPQPSKEDAAQALPLAQKALAHLNGILAAGQGTLESYKKALQ